MILINGAPDDNIPVTDRGLLYGDGVFETIAIISGSALNFDAHLARLSEGCRRLGIFAPAHEVLRDEADRLAGDCPCGVLKIIVTRGGGGRGYRPNPKMPVTRILMLQPAPDYPSENRTRGVVVGICNTRIADQVELAGIKHLNRLPQILARSEPGQDKFSESLMLDARGRLAEGSMSNLFMFRGQTLVTPPLATLGVAGTVRQVILEIAPELGWTTLLEEISVEELYAADEAFLSNSLIGIWPLRAIENTTLNSGKRSAQLLERLIRDGMVPP